MPVQSTLSASVGIVTGGASGIGRATAMALAAHGAVVAVVDVDDAGAAETVRSIVAAGGRALTYVADLLDPDACIRVVPEVARSFGRLDILVNAAGIGDATTLLDGTPETWERVYKVNLFAPFLLTQAAGRQFMAQGGGGRIVNLSSSSAYRATAFPAYGTSKAALSALTRIAAAELAPYDVNVNAVAPGLTRTPMVAEVLDDAALDEAARSGPMANLLGRASEPEDIAEVVVFLCSPASRQITAQTLHVSAGQIC